MVLFRRFTKTTTLSNACCKWTITHLKENYSQTVKVNFLETKVKTSHLYHEFKNSCLGGSLIQYSFVYRFVTGYSSVRHNSKSRNDQALKTKHTTIILENCQYYFL